MSDLKESQEDNRTLFEVMDDIGNLFDHLADEWSKLVKLQRENLEVFEKIKRGAI